MEARKMCCNPRLELPPVHDFSSEGPVKGKTHPCGGPSVAACHHHHQAVTCAGGSPRFILFLAGPCKAAWAHRVVRKAEEHLLSPLVFLSSPSSCLYRKLPPELRVASTGWGNRRSREMGNLGSTGLPVTLLGVVPERVWELVSDLSFGCLIWRLWISVWLSKLLWKDFRLNEKWIP